MTEAAEDMVHFFPLTSMSLHPLLYYDDYSMITFNSLVKVMIF